MGQKGGEVNRRRAPLGPREPVRQAALQPVECPRHAAARDRQGSGEQNEAQGGIHSPNTGRMARKPPSLRARVAEIDGHREELNVRKRRIVLNNSDFRFDHIYRGH